MEGVEWHIEPAMPPDAATFEELRPRMFGVAYRMLGSVADAEDVVQEAFLRWRDAEDVREPAAFLTTVVTRLCIDQLKSARSRRERYVGPWLPEPLMGESPDASAAAERRTRFEASKEKQGELLARFLLAIGTGEVSALVELLAADATLYADGGGEVRAARRPIYGADRIARTLLGVVKDVPPDAQTELVEVNRAAGFMIRSAGRPWCVITADAEGDRLQTIYMVLNPDKLRD
jgi:RNA polymerase sigma-70 factor (ECF subfamily)